MTMSAAIVCRGFPKLFSTRPLSSLDSRMQQGQQGPHKRSATRRITSSLGNREVRPVHPAGRQNVRQVSRPGRSGLTRVRWVTTCSAGRRIQLPMCPEQTHLQMARPEGFEPPTPTFVALYSIQLSYGRACTKIIPPQSWRYPIPSQKHRPTGGIRKSLISIRK